MNEERRIKAELVTKFPQLHDKVRLARVRRLFAQVAMADFAAVFDHLVRQMKFTMLCTITGLDQGAALGLIYHLAREDGVVLNLATSVPKDRPVVRSVSNYFPAADIYEREVVDLLGFEVEGLPPGPRYPLPDSWPTGQFPLRKDWKSESVAPPPGSEEKGDARE